MPARSATHYRSLVRDGINPSKRELKVNVSLQYYHLLSPPSPLTTAWAPADRAAVPDDLYGTLQPELPDELREKQDWRTIGEDWGVGPVVRTQPMAPSMTPRVFKVKEGSAQGAVQLLPKRKPEVVQIGSTPSERIGQLYTPSAAGLSPRLIATNGLPLGGIDSASGTVQLNTPRDLGEDGRVEVLLGGGPTTAGSVPPPKASHWREYGTAGENQNPSL